MARESWQLWSNYGGWMTWVWFSYFFWVLFVWLRHASLSWWLESSRAVENYLELFCPYKDHSASSTASSPHPTFWSRVDPSCWQHLLYSLSLACYLICFVNVCSCSLCCVAQCCICIILHFLPGVHYFACQGWRERWRAQRIQRSKSQKGNSAEMRCHDMPRCATVMPEVLTPIRLLNYTIVGWAVVSRQHIMSNLYLCWQLRQMPVE